MKILCVCEGGNTRSVTLATLLKYYHGGHDAIACSLAKNSLTTLKMLTTWADRILITDKWMEDDLVKKMHPIMVATKMILIPIGQDKWGMSMHPDLFPRASALLDEAGFLCPKSLEERIAKFMNKAVKYEQRRSDAEQSA